MPIQMAFMQFSPETDPMFNEKSRKVLMDYMGKREALHKKHGVKSLASWLVPYEHLLISVVEGSLDGINNLSMEPDNVAIYAYCTYDMKIALSVEEATKMLKQAK
jgi:hypothetical protein